MAEEMVQDNHYDIAIVGMAGRFPGALGVPGLWRNLCDGIESILPLSEAELEEAGVPREVFVDPLYVRAAAHLEDIESFDAGLFGFSPRDAELTDPQHRVFLECAWEALEDAGHAPETFPGRIGVYAGVFLSTYMLHNLIPNEPLVRSAGELAIRHGNEKDYMATRASYKLNLRGPSLSIQTSCSTSLVAAHLACQALLNRECDMALAGGVSLRIPQKSGYLYRPGGILSPDGHCRAFDARAGGTIFGHGAGLVVLRRLADALADGDRIFAVIKGSAINNDGSSKVGYTAPSVEGQAEVVAEAIAMAGIPPESIGYVEAHGTATALGDPIEIAGLTRAFREHTEARGFCAVGSVKTNVGHLGTAAGAVGLIKAALMLHHRWLPPSLHFEEPNPEIDFAASPFYVNTVSREWPGNGGPRRAGVSSFGMGGTNAHMVLEEAPAAPPFSPSRPWHLLVLSAASESSLDTLSGNLSLHLRNQPGLDAADVAFTLQLGRKALPWRRALVCRHLEDAWRALEDRDSARVLTTRQDRRDRPVAFLFPGQGAQHVGMGAELYRTEASFGREIDLCAEILRPRLGLDLRGLLFPAEGREEEAARLLEQTACAQPALLAVELALARWWMGLGVRPRALLGHSVGEYSAACVSEVLTLEEALDLVAERGRLMQAMPPGAMLAVPLSEEELEPWLEGELSLASVNGPSRCVVSGPVLHVEELEMRLRERGIESRRLRTSHAFHSAMMEPVLPAFAQALARVRLRPPKIPFLSNLTGDWITAEQAQNPGYWTAHLRHPVRFGQGIAALEQEDQVLLEVGPGRTLGTLVKGQVEPSRASATVSSMRHPRDREGEIESLLGATGRLWLAGVSLDWRALHDGQRRRRVSLPTYPFERQRFWVEPLSRAAPGWTGHARPEEPHAPPLQSPLDDWFYVPLWQQSPPLRRRGTQGTGRRWLLVLDAGGLGAALAVRLCAAGHEVVTVPPGDERSYGELAADLDARGAWPHRVVHLGALDGEPENGHDALRFTQDRGFRSLLLLLQALLARRGADPLKVDVILNGVQPVTGYEELHPGRATILGLCKAVPGEHPGVSLRSIDVDRTALALDGAWIETLLAELAAETPHRTVAYRAGRRWVQELGKVRLDGSEGRPPVLREDGVYLLWGGLDRPGHVLAGALGQWARSRLAAVGLGARDLRALREAGAEVLVLPEECVDPALAMERVEAAFGALHGVICHVGFAGRASLRPVLEMGEADCEALLVRLRELERIESALEGKDLDFCLVHSSLSSVVGGPCLAADAAAHLFTDALIHRHNRRSTTPWVCIHWDLWAASAIGEPEGLQAFQRILSAPELEQVAVSTLPPGTRMNRWLLPVTPPAGAVETPSRYPRPDLGYPYLAPANDLERRLADLWEELLGIDRVGARDDFFELGGDSLLATRMISRMRDTFLLDIPLRTFFEFPTVAQLAVEISRLQAERMGSQALSELLAEVQQLPPEEVLSLLAERRPGDGKVEIHE